MFNYKTGKEIKKSIVRIIIVISMDLFLLVGLFLIFKPLVIMAVIYTVLSISMIYPHYISLKLMRKLNALYIRDKDKVREILQYRLDDLKVVVHKNINPGEARVMMLNHKIQSRMERAKRRYKNRAINQYNLFLELRDIVNKDIAKQKKQEENEFSY